MNIRVFLLATSLGVFAFSNALAQVYPILFFRGMTEGVSERSLEIIDLKEQEKAALKPYEPLNAFYNQKLYALRRENNPINYRERDDQNLRDIAVLTEKTNAISGVINEKISEVFKKINVIVEDICKEKVAYAVLKLFPDSINYAEPACDITDDVYNRLNQEYLQSKNQK